MLGQGPLLSVTAIWWLLFWTAGGLAIGSFLNVVIHRVPLEQSLRNPRWSYCPQCLQRIRWYDNLPVLSFLRLGGQCRDCRTVISARYPVVEMLTAIVVLAVFDAFFVAQTRPGLYDTPYLTWALSEDWPIFLAHIILFACLLAMAAIDLREYWVDVRFTTVATWCGFALHTIWTPSHSMTRLPFREGWVRPDDPTALGCVGAMVGLGLTWIWLRCRWRSASADGLPGCDDDGTDDPQSAFLPPSSETEPSWADEPEGPIDTGGAPETEYDHRRPTSPQLGRVLLLAAGLLGLLIWLGIDAAAPDAAYAPGWRNAIPLVLAFLLILGEAAVTRATDREIVEAIEAERFSARRLALAEFGLLLPALLLGVAMVWLALRGGSTAEQLTEWLHWKASGNWQPWYGLSTAVTGFVIGGAIGWAVRIVFTLVLGKEAFGLGDIHMMAAAGCVAGWPIVLLGFLVTVFAALAGWLIMLPLKRSRAIPLVPWLALGYLAVVLHYEPLLRFAPIRNTIEVVHMLTAENSQVGAFGVSR